FRSLDCLHGEERVSPRPLRAKRLTVPRTEDALKGESDAAERRGLAHLRPPRLRLRQVPVVPLPTFVRIELAAAVLVRRGVFERALPVRIRPLVETHPLALLEGQHQPTITESATRLAW